MAWTRGQGIIMQGIRDRLLGRTGYLGKRTVGVGTRAEVTSSRTARRQAAQIGQQRRHRAVRQDGATRRHVQSAGEAAAAAAYSAPGRPQPDGRYIPRQSGSLQRPGSGAEPPDRTGRSRQPPPPHGKTGTRPDPQHFPHGDHHQLAVAGLTERCNGASSPPFCSASTATNQTGQSQLNVSVGHGSKHGTNYRCESQRRCRSESIDTSGLPGAAV